MPGETEMSRNNSRSRMSFISGRVIVHVPSCPPSESRVDIKSPQITLVNSGRPSSSSFTSLITGAPSPYPMSSWGAHLALRRLIQARTPAKGSIRISSSMRYEEWKQKGVCQMGSAGYPLSWYCFPA